MKTTRVAVVTDDPLSGDGAAAALRGRAEVEVVHAHRRAEAEVVLLIAVGGGIDVLGMLRGLRTDMADPRVVLVTDHLPERHVIRAVELGLVSVVPRRDASPARVVRAVVNAARRQADLPGELLHGLLEQIRVLHRDVLAPNGLTVGGLLDREVEVLRLLAEGLDTLEIAEQLNYSERTVKNVLHGMMSRLKLRNRSHAVAFGMRYGVL